MKKKSIDQLGQLQRAVLEVVWELEKATVHLVREQLAQEKELAYTTVLTALQNLEKAGWLTHQRQGKTYVYLPTRSREEAGTRSLHTFVKNVFSGDRLLMFQHLLEDDTMSESELSQLHAMINKKRKERSHGNESDS